VKDASGSFLKKRTEKLFSLWVAGCFERAVDWKTIALATRVAVATARSSQNFCFF
jgi:hypothetical protein